MQASLFVFILLFSFSGWPKSPLRAVCDDKETEFLKKAVTIQDLEKSICRLVNFKSATASIQDLSYSVLEIVTKYKEENKDQTNWRENQELDHAVRNLTAAVTQAGRSQSPKNKGPLASAMYNLTKKYGSFEQRNADRTGYLDALRKTTLLTNSGRKVYACFANSDKNFKPGHFTDEHSKDESNVPPPLGYGGGMGFMVFPEEEKNIDGLWEKAIVFNFKSDPIFALLSLQHEFKHACNADQAIKCAKKRVISTDHDASCDQEAAIDELQAYKFDTEALLEMAKSAPELVCSLSMISNSFGKVPVRRSDFQASYDELMQNGYFVDHLIKYYLETGTYSSENSFYETSTNGQKKIRSDFLKKIEDAGFFYKAAPP